MKTFIAKVVVKLKPNIPDARGLVLKRAIESIMEVENLTCRIGTSFSFEFDAENQIEALNIIDKIAEDLLVNNVTEDYEVRALNEV